jgi:hypothetical protein
MSAWTEYRFGYIAPNASAGVYIHGYSNRQSVTYSAVVYALSGDAYYPLGKIKMTQDITVRHVDGTVAREIWVQNLAPFNPCAVDLNIMSESF